MMRDQASTSRMFNIDTYCVFGNPIAHSLSPQIHTQFAKNTQQELVYEKQCIQVDQFPIAVKNFFDLGGKGLNITVPFKQEAWRLAERRTQRAELAGAVNTLWMDEEQTLHGDNTDGAGLVRDIKRLNWSLNNQHILLLGAGGAARGVILPLLQEKPASLTIANRTFSKAEELKSLFSDYGEVYASKFEALRSRQPINLIINATSAGLGSERPPLSPDLINGNTAIYDMVYGDKALTFLNWCKNCGAEKLADGLGMLVGQAAESFNIWRGVMPEVLPVIHTLRPN